MPTDFLQTVSLYSDEELLKRFEKPYELESEEYAAILMVLLEREFITKSEFDDYFSGMEKPTDKNQIHDESDDNEQEDENEEIRENPDAFWKCPECGETIEIHFDTCWNCMCSRPGQIEHPTGIEVKNYVNEKKPISLPQTGLTVIILTAVVFAVSYFWDDSDSRYWYDYHIGRYIFLSITFIIGWIIFFIGIIKSSKD